MAVATATPPVKPNTAKSGRRLNATGSEDGGSRETSRRVPQADKSTATKQPESARVKFSVNNCQAIRVRLAPRDRKSTRLNSSHGYISYAVFCLKKKKKYEAARSEACCLPWGASPPRWAFTSGSVWVRRLDWAIATAGSDAVRTCVRCGLFCPS